MSEEEKIAERLREYFWDEEALTAALGSVEGGATPGRGRFRLEHCYRGRLSSCYRGAAGREPAATSWHRSFKGTVDYLFHSEGIVTRRVLLPPTSVSGGRLPSEEYASDHFSVVADVSL